MGYSEGPGGIWERDKAPGGGLRVFRGIWGGQRGYLGAGMGHLGGSGGYLGTRMGHSGASGWCLGIGRGYLGTGRGVFGGM